MMMERVGIAADIEEYFHDVRILQNCFQVASGVSPRREGCASQSTNVDDVDDLNLEVVDSHQRYCSISRKIVPFEINVKIWSIADRRSQGVHKTLHLLISVNED
jgi:hypothetical protein